MMMLTTGREAFAPTAVEGTRRGPGTLPGFAELDGIR
jgi:hypothetical protein